MVDLAELKWSTSLTENQNRKIEIHELMIPIEVIVRTIKYFFKRGEKIPRNNVFIKRSINQYKKLFWELDNKKIIQQIISELNTKFLELITLENSQEYIISIINEIWFITTSEVANKLWDESGDEWVSDIVSGILWKDELDLEINERR
jgi:hypothetical protein